jgi:hypothetical protein
MIDPFTSWSRMMSAAFDMSMLGMRMVETASASNDVINARTPMIKAAMQSPLDANYGELSRMVPEKVTAFSAAGSVMMKGWWAMNAAFWADSQHIATMMARGRLPTLGESSALANRTAARALSMMEGAVDTGSRALSPVHKTATSNARRLNSKR